MASSYQHVQSTASSLWVVNHGLVTTTPIIDVMVDVSGTLTKIIPKDIRAITTTQVEVEFTIPYKGECRIL